MKTPSWDTGLTRTAEHESEAKPSPASKDMPAPIRLSKLGCFLELKSLFSCLEKARSGPNQVLEMCSCSSRARKALELTLNCNVDQCE